MSLGWRERDTEVDRRVREKDGGIERAAAEEKNAKKRKGKRTPIDSRLGMCGIAWDSASL